MKCKFFYVEAERQKQNGESNWTIRDNNDWTWFSIASHENIMIFIEDEMLKMVMFAANNSSC